MKEYNINITEDKKNKLVKIELSGLLNIANIKEIKKEIDAVIKSNKSIELKIDNPEEADLSLMQLLIAIQKEQERIKTKIKINLELNKETLELFSRAGFSETFN